MYGTKRIKQRTSSEKRILLAAGQSWSRGVLASMISRATVARVETVPRTGRYIRTVGQPGRIWSTTNNTVIVSATRISRLRAQIARFKLTTLLDNGKATLCRRWNMRAKQHQAPAIVLALKLMRKRIHSAAWTVPLPYHRKLS